MARLIRISIFLLIIAGLFYICYREELTPAWKKHQLSYLRYLKKIGAKSDIKDIKKIEISVKWKDKKRIDRCPSCHVGYKNPVMKDCGEPFRSHPGISPHSFSKIGCTLCHGGDGRSLAKYKAHGFINKWRNDNPEKQILMGRMVEANCYQCHSDMNTLGLENLKKGYGLFNSRGCNGCHSIEKKGGRDDFGNIGLRLDVDTLKNKILFHPNISSPSIDETFYLVLFLKSRKQSTL